jgi:ABC-type uncharacterized transport system permease subunit
VTARLNAYWQVMRFAAREDSANPMRIAASVALGIARMVLLAAIYKVAYTATGGDNALSYAAAVWSIGLYFALVMGLNVRHVFKLIEHEVVSGKVEVGLLRPVDWRLSKLCQQVGKNVLECVALVVAFTAALIVLVGVPDLSHISVQFTVGYTVLLILAIVSAGVMNITIGLAAFWLNDAESVYRIVDKAVMIVAGAYVPVALLPELMQTVLRYSPFGVYGASTQLFNPELNTYMIPTLWSAAGWTLFFVVLCQLVWKRAQRRIEVNGG